MLGPSQRRPFTSGFEAAHQPHNGQAEAPARFATIRNVRVTQITDMLADILTSVISKTRAELWHVQGIVATVAFINTTSMPEVVQVITVTVKRRSIIAVLTRP